MRRTAQGKGTGIRWKLSEKLEDLDFADDLVLISSKYWYLQTKTNKMTKNPNRTGFRVNVKTCKVMCECQK